MPVVDGPAVLGTATVLQHKTEKASNGVTRLLVEVRYRAEQASPSVQKPGSPSRSAATPSRASRRRSSLP